MNFIIEESSDTGSAGCSALSEPLLVQLTDTYMISITNTIIQLTNMDDKFSSIEDCFAEYEQVMAEDIFTETGGRLLAIQDKWKRLSESERRLIMLYAECGSFREVGRRIGFSHTTISKKINEIRAKLC